MSLDNVYWGGRGNCPKCGKWCGNIEGVVGEVIGLKSVSGVCKDHGKVDLSHQEWGFDDFVSEGEVNVRLEITLTDTG